MPRALATVLALSLLPAVLCAADPTTEAGEKTEEARQDGAEEPGGREKRPWWNLSEAEQLKRREAAQKNYEDVAKLLLNGQGEAADQFLKKNVQEYLPRSSPLKYAAIRTARKSNEPINVTVAEEIKLRIEAIEEKAKEAALKALRLDPDDPKANATLSGLLSRRGNHHESLRYTERALRRRPKDPDVHAIRSRDLYELGDNEEAVKAATKAIELDASNADAFSTRAAAAYKLGDFRLALADARRAVRLNPDDHMAATIAGVANKKLKGEPLDARALDPQRSAAETAAEQAPPAPEAPARAALPAGLETPSSGPAPSYRAQSLYKQSLTQLDLGDYQGAVQSASASIGLSPASPEPYAARAAAHNYLGRHEEAIADAGRSLALAPDNPIALNARAWAFNHTNRPKEALADSRRAVELAPRDSFSLMNRAMAEEALGLWDEVEQDYQAALAVDPGLQPQVQEAAVRFERATGRAMRFPGSARTASAGKSRRGWTFSALALVGGLGGGFLLAFLLVTSRSQPSEDRIKTSGPGVSEVEPLVGGCYRIVREIGRGGMGVVYQAEDLSLNRTVALKKMKEELRLRPRDKDRFLQEARTVAGLRHPNIVEIYSVFEDGGDLYLVFEHVDGMTLDEHLYRRGRLSPRETRDILAAVCGALSYAHGQKVIHRDLKPSNIMITAEGAVKVMDFGLARQAKDTLSALTQTDAAGTPAYMAPEMGKGQPRRESDIFMLGGVLYESLTGKMPFEGADLEGQKLRRSYPPPSELNSEVPAGVDAVVSKALSPAPEDRFHSPQDLLAAYDAAIIGEPRAST